MKTLLIPFNPWEHDMKPFTLEISIPDARALLALLEQKEEDWPDVVQNLRDLLDDFVVKHISVCGVCFSNVREKKGE